MTPHGVWKDIPRWTKADRASTHNGWFSWGAEAVFPVEETLPHGGDSSFTQGRSDCSGITTPQDGGGPRRGVGVHRLRQGTRTRSRIHTCDRLHRRRLADDYRYLILDGVSVRIRLVGKVQRRRVLCVMASPAKVSGS